MQHGYDKMSLVPIYWATILMQAICLVSISPLFHIIFMSSLDFSAVNKMAESMQLSIAVD